MSCRSRRGLTLIELVIALGLLGLITGYLLSTFTVNQQTYSIVEQVSEVQQNLRSAATLLERDIRHTGFMVPGGGAFCAVDNFSGSDILYLTDPVAFDPLLLSGTNNGAAFGGSNVSGWVLNDLSLNLVVEPGVGSPAYDTTDDGIADSDFQEEAGAIITDRDDSSRGTACGRVDTINVGTGLLRVEMESDKLGTSGGGADLIAIPAIEYRVAGGVLLRNGIEMVRGVDDLQVAFQIDLNDDYVDDPNEMHGDGIGPDYDSRTVDVSRAREIRVNLVLRTRGQDPGFADGQFQSFENRVAVAGNDGFRRRSYTAREVLRNVVMR